MENPNNLIAALETINFYFNYHTEAYSCFQEYTENGIFTKKDTENFTDEEYITVAEDLRYQIKCELS